MLASLHEIILSSFAFLENLVTNVWDVVDGTIHIVMRGWFLSHGCLHHGLLMLVNGVLKLRLDVVEVVHLFAFVILE